MRMKLINVFKVPQTFFYLTNSIWLPFLMLTYLQNVFITTLSPFSFPADNNCAK